MQSPLGSTFFLVADDSRIVGVYVWCSNTSNFSLVYSGSAYGSNGCVAEGPGASAKPSAGPGAMPGAMPGAPSMAPSCATMEAHAEALETPAARIAACMMRRGIVKRARRTLRRRDGEGTERSIDGFDRVSVTASGRAMV